jgi:hypothetical protein
LDGSSRNAQGGRDLFVLEAPEESAFHHLPLPRLQPIDRVIQGKESGLVEVGRPDSIGQGDPGPRTSSFGRLSAPSPVNQYLPHRVGGDGKEMGPFDRMGDAAREFQVGFMNQRCGLNTPGSVLAVQLPLGDPDQVIIDERDEPVERRSVASLGSALSHDSPLAWSTSKDVRLVWRGLASGDSLSVV